MHEFFRKFAHGVAHAAGSGWAFALAVGVIVAWAVTGPIFDYSDTWQLVINTGTTIVTFLMVFLIQNTQNRDALAMHLKLDELLRAVAKARTGLVDLEDLSDKELRSLQQEFERLRRETTATPGAGAQAVNGTPQQNGTRRRRKRHRRQRQSPETKGP